MAMRAAVTASSTVDIGREGRGLEAAGDAGVGAAVRRLAGDIDAGDVQSAAIGGFQPGDEVDQRRLAGTVRADDAKDLTAVELKGDVGDGAYAAEAFGETFNVQHGEVAGSAAPEHGGDGAGGGRGGWGKMRDRRRSSDPTRPQGAAMTVASSANP